MIRLLNAQEIQLAVRKPVLKEFKKMDEQLSFV